MTEQTREAVDSYITAANKKPGEVLFGGPPRSEFAYNDPTICPTGLPMDCQHRARPELLREPLTAPNQSNPHLSPYRQFAACTASVGAQED